MDGRHGIFRDRDSIHPQRSDAFGFKGAVVNAREVRLLSAIAASAVVGVGAVVVAATEPNDSAAGSSMQTGVTSTERTPSTAPATEKATPAIKGPAPLPSEDQGVPS